jgi:hypothetical protein
LDELSDPLAWAIIRMDTNRTEPPISVGSSCDETTTKLTPTDQIATA